MRNEKGKLQDIGCEGVERNRIYSVHELSGAILFGHLIGGSLGFFESLTSWRTRRTFTVFFEGLGETRKETDKQTRRVAVNHVPGYLADQSNAADVE